VTISTGGILRANCVICSTTITELEQKNKRNCNSTVGGGTVHNDEFTIDGTVVSTGGRTHLSGAIFNKNQCEFNALKLT
jgi:hypothetical protein